MIFSLFRKLEGPKWFIAFFICLLLFLPISSFEMFIIKSNYCIAKSITDFLDFLPTAIEFFISFIFIFISISIANTYLNLNDINYRRNYLPLLFSFIFISLFNIPFFSFLVALSVFLLFVSLWQLTDIIKDEKNLICLFNASLLLGILSLIFPHISIYLLLAYIVLLIFRIYYTRNWIMLLIGFSLPFLYYFSYQFIINDMFDFSRYLTLSEEKIHSFFTIDNLIKDNYIWITTGFLSFIGFFKTISKAGEAKINVRKSTSVFLWFFVISIVLLFINNFCYYMIILIIAFPVGFFIYTSLYKLLNKKFIQHIIDISFIIYMLLIVYYFVTIHPTNYELSELRIKKQFVRHLTNS